MMIFAAGELVSFIIFLVFAGIGLVNQIMNQRQTAEKKRQAKQRRQFTPPPPANQPQAAAPPRPQPGNEIDRFLQEILGQAPQPTPVPTRRPPAKSRANNVVELKPRRQTLVEKRKAVEAKDRREVERERIKAEMDLDDRVDRELDEVGRQATVGAAERVRNAGRATQSSGSNLETHNTTVVTGHVNNLMKELRTVEGIRRALVISEILGRPLSKRH